MSYGRSYPSITITTLTLTLTTLASTYFITKKISQYGLAGSLRLLWEGDHLPPNIREAIDSLDELANRAIPKQGRKLDKIDCTIQLAKLNSVDDDGDDDNTGSYADNDNESVTTNTTTASASTTATANTAKTSSTSTSSNTTTSSASARRRHYIVSQTPQISKELITLSLNLDKLAAKVDAIQSHGDGDVRRRKKELSTLLVEMMDRVDAFISECGVEVNS